MRTVLATVALIASVLHLLPAAPAQAAGLWSSSTTFVLAGQTYRTGDGVTVTNTGNGAPLVIIEEVLKDSQGNVLGRKTRVRVPLTAKARITNPRPNTRIDLDASGTVILEGGGCGFAPSPTPSGPPVRDPESGIWLHGTLDEIKLVCSDTGIDVLGDNCTVGLHGNNNTINQNGHPTAVNPTGTGNVVRK